MLSFDEINRLDGRDTKVLSIDKFFDETGLTKSQKADRKEFARYMDKGLYDVLAYIHLSLQRGYDDGIRIAKQRVNDLFLGAVGIALVADTTLMAYAERYANDFVESTVRNQETPYFFTSDRARLNAENEAATAFNYAEFQEAIDRGRPYKKWNAMDDLQVRATHEEVNGIILPITEAFIVGGFPMMYPRDMSAPVQEVANCRCWLTFPNKL